jgi:glutamate-1-semialdehyde 2,1-aminomutase
VNDKLNAGAGRQRSGNSLLGIEERYRQGTASSAAVMAQAAASMPGGNTRTTSYHPPYPVVFERGDGPWLWDIEGTRFLDLFCNGLSLIHGNNYAPAREAVSRALSRGTAWAGASREQIAFAECIQQRLKAAELVRFTNSGSEAGMLAVKAARHVTGRPLIIKAVGAYHGSYPDLEAGLYGQGDIDGRAVVASFNDLASFEQVMQRHEGGVAAVVIEPVLVTGRVVPPAAGFLLGLQALARRHGALVILDDCLMLRLAVGGSSECFGLDPDLIVLGKFIGGGTPMGVLAGSREVMQIFNPNGPRCVFHGGSFNGNLIGCVAGRVTLEDLTARRISTMDAATTSIRNALSGRAAELGLAVTVSGMGSVAGVAFTADPDRHEDDPSKIGVAALFHLACLNEGILLGPGGIIAVSTAHDSEAIDYAIGGLGAALDAVARAPAVNQIN